MCALSAFPSMSDAAFGTSPTLRSTVSYRNCEAASEEPGKPAPAPATTETETPVSSPQRSTGNGTGAGVATAVRPAPAPARPTPDVLPPWRVLLHNDDRNDMDYVVETIVRVVRLNRPSATRCMVEAHRKGCGQVLATHRERAEFLAEQLRSCRLTVTIEPVR